MFIQNHSQLLSYLSPEQRLLISVCSPQKSDGREDLKGFLEKPFSWEQLIRLGERHRLLPLLYNNLRVESANQPIEMPALLKEKYALQTQHVLKLATEGVRISTLFDREGMESILLKGPFLSQQIYNNPTVRPSRDIDILVLPENIERVNDLFLDEGYRMVYPDFELSTKQQKFYQLHKNQYAYRSAENGCLVEVHWRLFSQRGLFPISTERVFEEKQELIIAGKPIHVLSKNHCIEHLCLHGALHQWFRLLWLRDIAQLLGDEKENLAEILRLAKKNGNDRSVEQAIILSNLFFGSPVSLPGIKAKHPLTSITNQATTAIISDESKALSRKISRMRVPFYRMKLKRGAQYKLSCWTILQPNFADWKKVKLPDSLFFLYFLLRPFIWFYSFYIERRKRNG